MAYLVSQCTMKDNRLALVKLGALKAGSTSYKNVDASVFERQEGGQIAWGKIPDPDALEPQQRAAEIARDIFGTSDPKELESMTGYQVFRFLRKRAAEYRGKGDEVSDRMNRSKSRMRERVREPQRHREASESAAEGTGAAREFGATRGSDASTTGAATWPGDHPTSRSPVRRAEEWASTGWRSEAWSSSQRWPDHYTGRTASRPPTWQERGWTASSWSSSWQQDDGRNQWTSRRQYQ